MPSHSSFDSAHDGRYSELDAADKAPIEMSNCPSSPPAPRRSAGDADEREVAHCVRGEAIADGRVMPK